jgi:SPX domain protein involved in polyphosphate accumulation
MKFCHTLQTHLLPQWRFYYLDYDGLNIWLRDKTCHALPGSSATARGMSEEHEGVFGGMVYAEIEKVCVKVKGFEDGWCGLVPRQLVCRLFSVVLGE